MLELPRANRWQVLARAALRDDLSVLSRALTIDILRTAPASNDVDAAISAWTAANSARAERFAALLADIRAARIYDLTTLPVALREARNLLADERS